MNPIQQIVLSKLDIPLQKSNVRSIPFPLIKNKFKFNKKKPLVLKHETLKLLEENTSRCQHRQNLFFLPFDSGLT